MKITSSRLETIAVMESQYPDESLKEIAFVGRSNVGKSSFINSFINRKALARTSGKPGKTRTINFYNINEEFRLVDLPGYGYAKVSKKEKEKWGEIINEYLHSRENLVEVVLLVDMRHKPTDEDLMMYNWIKHFGFKGIIIATKADKISRGKWQQHEKIIREKLQIEDSVFISYSSEKLFNKDRVAEAFVRLLED